MISIRSAARLAICTMLLSAVWGCADVAVTEIDIPPDTDMLASVVVTPRGATMAVGDVEVMEVKGYNILGEPIPYVGRMPDSVVFRSADSTRLRIDSLGNMTALRTTTSTAPLRVIVSWTRKGITRRDTAFVKINAARPGSPVESIQIGPLSGMTTYRSPLVNWVSMTTQGFAAGGAPVSGVYAYLQTDRRRLNIGPDAINPQTVILTPKVLGKFWIYAESRVYGVTLRDSMQWVATYDTSYAAECIIQSTGFDNCATEVTRESLPRTVEQCAIVTFGNTIAMTGAGVPAGPARSIRFEVDDLRLFGQCPGTEDETGPIGVLQPGESVRRRFATLGSTVIRAFLLDAKQTQVMATTIAVRNTPE